MENVLETYEKPYNPLQPVICMDEQPVQLIKETRQPVPATKDHPERVDYEYERNGTASILCSANPLAVGDRQRHANTARNMTGLRKSLHFWTDDTPNVNESRLSATISTRIRLVPSTKRLNQSEHALTFSELTFASHPNTAAG